MNSDSSTNDDVDEVFDESAFWKETRCEPVGADRDDDANSEIKGDPDRFRSLEEEHDALTSSVFTLTSHLAQVEFRLRQILKAPSEDKDDMLKALEEFTSRGLPDTKELQPSDICVECEKLDEKMRKQRIKQEQFIQQLKVQLKELEKFTGNGGLEKHKSYIDNLKAELDVNLRENYQDGLSADEIGHQISCALHQFATNKISKEEITKKLQKHIDEMQNFLKMMNGESNATSQKSKIHNEPIAGHSSLKSKDALKSETLNLMKKASDLIQIFTVSQFGNSTRPAHQPYQQNKDAYHWGNLRAKLEMSIEAVLNLVRMRTKVVSDESYESDSEENTLVLNNVPLTTAVRKHLAMNIKDLLQHGLEHPHESGTLVPLMGCLNLRRHSSSTKIHIWELVLKYYEINNGDKFNSTPARKLSQSFDLDIVGGVAISNKHILLSAIDDIVATHTPYKRSYDAHFKAFVCLALNSQKLVLWLNLILKCKSMIQSYYSSTSYVVNTGFQDSLHSLDRLTPYKFDLPVDLAVKQFQNIKDVFS